MQAALEFVEERANSVSVSGSGSGNSDGSICGTTGGPIDCAPARPALVFLHAALYQEECLAIDSDIQLIGFYIIFLFCDSVR